MTENELLLVFDRDVDQTGLERWLKYLDSLGASVFPQRLGASTVLVAIGLGGLPRSEQLPAPLAAVSTTGGIRLACRELVPDGTVVPIGAVTVGDGTIAVFAGPCAVESRDQMLATATAVASDGAVGLRGGAFKPRTSPYTFQGLRWAGLDLLVEARDVTGLPIVSEVVEPAHVVRLAEVVDAFQVGARNMQNFGLLTELGQTGMPVVLKRGFGATVDELLAAAEYILAEGNDKVLLCERGIRTFEYSTRFTLDLSAVALLKRRTHLPVMVDPSHASGLPELIEPLALGAAAVGADALLIDVHVRPDEARCDGKQALLPAQFGELMQRLRMLAVGLGREVAGRQPETTAAAVPVVSQPHTIAVTAQDGGPAG